MYKSLQAGRAFAAILVVLFHLGGTIAAEKYFGINAFSIPFSFGAAGVEFFFVLSGFIILTAHRHDIFRPDKLASYVRKRTTRLYPAYWIIFLAVYLLALSSSTLRSTVPQDVVTVLKSLLLIPQDAAVVGGTGAPVLIVAWTLQYEMFFYFFFALLILNKWLSIAAGLVLLYVYAAYSGTPSLSFPLTFLSSDYLLLFAMGMLVSVACTSKKVITHKPIIYLGVGVILFLLIALDTVLQTKLLIDREIIPYGVASSLIVFGLVQAEDRGQVIGGGGVIQLLGDSSYVLYLIHYPLISILCKLSIFIHLNSLGLIGAFIAYFSIFGVCLASSVAFHLWVEKPVAAYIRNRRLGGVFIVKAATP